MSLRLKCIIESDDTVFLVTVADDDGVSDLKERIQAKRALGSLKDVDPHTLELWKPKDSNPIDSKPQKTLAERIVVLDFAQSADELDPTDSVLDIFPTQPPRDKIHIIVRVPRKGSAAPLDHPAEIAHNKALAMANAASPPSIIFTVMKNYEREQEYHPVYNGRPGNRRGPPIAIYHPVFAELKDMLRNPTKVVDQRESQRVNDTAKLMLASTAVYDSEKERGGAIYDYLKALLAIDTLEESVETRDDHGMIVAEVDFMFQQAIEDKAFESKAPVIFGELKNELGMSGPCGLENALTLRKHLAAKKYNGLRDATCCPCLTISVAGPYIAVGGAIFADVVVVEAFTDFIYMGGQPFDKERTITLSRKFAAIAQAVMGLRRFYYELRWSATADVHRLLPRPTYYDNRKPDLRLVFDRRFDYEGMQSSEYRRALFCAKYGEEDVLVKFCETYHGEGHRIVAEAGFAPKLFFCEQIKGGVTMVIMERLKARNAYHRFRFSPLPVGVLDDIKSAISVLHKADLVFGDLRRPNVLIKETGEGELRALLVDFEWTGQENEARYPPSLNDSGMITWAVGVGPHTLMKREHDIEMIRLLNILPP